VIEYGLEVPFMLREIDRRAADDGNVLVPEPADGQGLRRVQIAGRDDPRTAFLQRHEQRHRLRLEVNPCADGPARKWLRRAELLADRL
jgi:hypothetical protein